MGKRSRHDALEHFARAKGRATTVRSGRYAQPNRHGRFFGWLYGQPHPHPSAHRYSDGGRAMLGDGARARMLAARKAQRQARRVQRAA